GHAARTAEVKNRKPTVIDSHAARQAWSTPDWQLRAGCERVTASSPDDPGKNFAYTSSAVALRVTNLPGGMLDGEARSPDHPRARSRALSALVRRAPRPSGRVGRPGSPNRRAPGRFGTHALPRRGDWRRRRRRRGTDLSGPRRRAHPPRACREGRALHLTTRTALLGLRRRASRPRRSPDLPLGPGVDAREGGPGLVAREMSDLPANRAAREVRGGVHVEVEVLRAALDVAEQPAVAHRHAPDSRRQQRDEVDDDGAVLARDLLVDVEQEHGARQATGVELPDEDLMGGAVAGATPKPRP